MGYIHSITIDPTDSNVVYAVITARLRKSTDGGKTWSRKAKRLEMSSFAVDPTRPQVLFAGDYYGQVFVSPDGGESWVPFDTTGLPQAILDYWKVDFIIDSPRNTLYLCQGQGVFSYTRTVVPGGPMIDVLVPASESVGESITIYGRNLGFAQGNGKVFFGNLEADEVLSWSDNQIVVRVPSGVRSSALTVYQDSKTSNPYPFSVRPTEGTGSIEPSSGPAVGGTLVTIVTPSGVTRETCLLEEGSTCSVQFSATLCKDLAFVESDTVTCITPPGTGTVEVSLVTNVASYNIGAFTYQ